MAETNRKVIVEGKPRFIGVVNWPSHKVRGYIHSEVLKHFSDNTWAAFHNSVDYFRGCFENDQTDATYTLAAVWHNGSDRMIDVFRYYLDAKKSWPGNPVKHSWAYENGILVPTAKLEDGNVVSNEVNCGDGTILLGAEEQYRRRTFGLDEYLKNRPIIRGFGGEYFASINMED